MALREPGQAVLRASAVTATSGDARVRCGRRSGRDGRGTRPGQAAEVVEAVDLLSDLELDELSDEELEEPESLLLPFELDEAGVEDELVERLSVR